MNTKLPSLTRGDIKVEWTNLNEGVNGDYDESDPNDVKFLRFDIYKWNSDADDGWEAVDDASYCTHLPADTSEEILKKALEHIMNIVYDPILTDGNAKRLCERLSWIAPNDFAPKPTASKPVAKNYCSDFLGHISKDDTTKSFVADVRKILRGTGYYVRLRGNNTNRKQFVSANEPSHSYLRMGLPLKYATYLRAYLYIRGDHPMTNVTREFAKGMVEAVCRVYRMQGKTLNSTVPSKLKGA